MNIGLFGGSFNPIHIGHAIIANHIVQFSGIDQLWFMVAPQNPLKAKTHEVSDSDRLRMVELVSRRLDKAITSAFEFGLPYPSYTINTIKALQRKFPNDKFTLIIGADNWATFDKWKAPDEIISLCNIMVYPRVGYPIVIPDAYKNKVTAVDAPIIEISSTAIRQHLKCLDNMVFYLPDDVYQYILQHKLYVK